MSTKPALSITLSADLTVRRVVLATFVVAAVGLLFLLLLRFHDIVLILFIAIAISLAIRPLVEWLHRFGLPRPLGIIVVYLSLPALLALAIWLGAPVISRQVGNLTLALPDMYQGIRQSMLETPNLIIWRLGIELPAQLPTAVNAPPADEETVASFGQALLILQGAARLLFGALVTLVLAFYWTLDGERTKRALLLLVPLEQRDDIREFVTTLEQKVSGYVVGQGTLVLIIGVASLVAYLLIGLPNALLLAVVAGLMEAVPIIGPILGAVPALLVAFGMGPTAVLWVIVATIIIQQLENNFLVPRVMNRAVGVNPLVTLLALIAFGSLFGLAGAVVAIPLAAVVQSFLDRYLLTVSPEPSLEGRDRLSALRYGVQELMGDVRKQVRNKEGEASIYSDEIEDSLETIAAELDALLADDGREAVE